MDLWIRSQDKTRLVKVNYVYMTENNDHLTIYGETIDSAPIVGTYKSKERALGVLDEIQEAQLGNFHYRCSSNVKVSSKEDTLIYEMPEK